MDEIDQAIHQAKIFKLTMIGKALNDLFVALGETYHDAPLIKSMIDELYEYEDQFQQFGWITDPTGYRDFLHNGGLVELARRKKLLAALIEFYGYPASEDDDTPPGDEEG